MTLASALYPAPLGCTPSDVNSARMRPCAPASGVHAARPPLALARQHLTYRLTADAAIDPARKAKPGSSIATHSLQNGIAEKDNVRRFSGWVRLQSSVCERLSPTVFMRLLLVERRPQQQKSDWMQ